MSAAATTRARDTRSSPVICHRGKIRREIRHGISAHARTRQLGNYLNEKKKHITSHYVRRSSVLWPTFATFIATVTRHLERSNIGKIAISAPESNA